MRASGDFATAIGRGKCRKTQTVAVYVLYLPHSTQADLSKVGFVVSKKVGNSVIRHRVSRQLRHIMRSLIPFERPAHVVVRAQPRAASASFHRIAADVTAACAYLGLSVETQTPHNSEPSIAPAVEPTTAVEPL